MIKIELGKFGIAQISIENGRNFIHLNEQAAELIYIELHKERQKIKEDIEQYINRNKEVQKRNNLLSYLKNKAMEKPIMKKEIILNEFEKSYIISKIEEDIKHTNFRTKAIDMMTENGTKKNIHHIQELEKLENEINRLKALKEKML